MSQSPGFGVAGGESGIVFVVPLQAKAPDPTPMGPSSDQMECVKARALLDHVEIDHEAHKKVISILAKVHGKKDKNISVHDTYVCQYYHSGQQFSPLISTPSDILLLVVPPASLAHTTGVRGIKIQYPARP